MIRIFAGLVFVGLALYMLKTEFGSYLVYFDLSSILFVGVSVVALAIMRHGVKGFYPMTEERISSLMTISIAVGCAGFLFGSLRMMGNMTAPEELGPASALALMSTFYSFLVVLGLYCWKGSATQHHLPFYSVLSVVFTSIITMFIYSFFKN